MDTNNHMITDLSESSSQKSTVHTERPKERNLTKKHTLFIQVRYCSKLAKKQD